MALLLIGMMLAILLGALVLSKGRRFFKYAEMSRGLTPEEQPATPGRTRQHAAR